MSKHTPTPWRVITKRAATTKVEIYGDVVTKVAVVPYTPFRKDKPVARNALLRPEYLEGRANAAFIVRAVNCHEELVAALETTLEALDMMASGKSFNDVVEETGVTAAVSTALQRARN